MNVLDKICKLKLNEIKELKKSIDYKEKLNITKRRGFFRRLLSTNSINYNLIAEIKKSSPSKGNICKNFNLKNIACAYEDAGAACLSILTEKNFFEGDINFISQVKKMVKIPILRKDFIIDEWQIYESYFHGADCILLILAILDDHQVSLFYKIAKELGLDVITEVHDSSELDRALKLKVNCIGINNRNLKTLEINLNTFSLLSKRIPKGIIKLCESGISTNQQLRDFHKKGADAFLIGESLMSSPNIKLTTEELIKK